MQSADASAMRMSASVWTAFRETAHLDVPLVRRRPAATLLAQLAALQLRLDRLLDLLLPKVDHRVLLPAAQATPASARDDVLGVSSMIVQASVAER